MVRTGTGRRACWLALVLVLVILALAGWTQDPGRAVEKRYGLDTDFAANMRVELIGQRIALAAGLSDIHYVIFHDRELNAFALPDGRIYVTSLMAHAVTDDELAFVLGHEMTHIKERHAKGQSERATGGALLGALLAAVLGGGESAIRMGADIVGGLTLGHYSRKDERRADTGGLELMARAGYDPQRAPAAMQRLIDRYGRGDASVPVLGWFATHPDSRTRRERLQTGAAELLQRPPPRLAPATAVAFALDPRCVETHGWAYNYFSLALAAESGGRALVLPPLDGQPLPALAPSSTASNSDEKDKKKEKAKEEPLPTVTVTAPDLPIGYRASLFFEPVPAGRAASLETQDGTAVRAVLQWTDAATGMTGTYTAVAQTRAKVAWQAREQLRANPEALRLLSAGVEEHLEGTLEAAAVRRVVRAYAEIFIAGGPVDHSAPVTLKLTDGKARPGDAVAVIRDGKLVAEVA
ncbi:MAG TPA: M48 family metalloprotease, partial [Armatimonadota bacterium]|nr:M48 family metalloprotease [Armatimonadota bacterium]